MAALLLPGPARAEEPGRTPDLRYLRPGTVLTVGSAGAWTLNRPGIDWLNLKLDHCDGLERELGECQGRTAGASASGFWRSSPGIRIKVAGGTVVVVFAVYGLAVAGQKLEDVVRGNTR